ncbi:hypothetical protein [Blastococcus haudaquaticus]|uniref:DUF4386 family protein n=1 Tax=Blastococcus haudaquaticus TaxID=1938745 RepID=A0A286H2Q0_9ACTN|nr:hypothetical protein [Blastococcus haudaquaticus]SOE01574.1 hypothetical protein SAMN06272739_3250 [Blastococcus haudaquaticus]
MTTATVEGSVTSRTHSPLSALAGVGALACFAAATVLSGDSMGGSDTPAEAAAALESSHAQLAAVLVGGYALLAIAVTGGLAVRLRRGGDSAAVRLLPLLGAVHVLLLAATFAAPGAAVGVGTYVFDGGVSANATEAALVLMNTAHPMAAWVGAGFLIAVALAARTAAASRALVVVSAVCALGLLLPPVGWAVTYLMAFWFAGVGVWLWRRG